VEDDVRETLRRQARVSPEIEAVDLVTLAADGIEAAAACRSDLDRERRPYRPKYAEQRCALARRHQPFADLEERDPHEGRESRLGGSAVIATTPIRKRVSRSLQGRRIVLVVPWAILGGAERSAFELMRQLRDRESAHVDVLAFADEPGRFREAVEEAGFAWHSLPLSWHGGKVAKARSLVALTHGLRALHPDVIAPYTSRPNVLCGLVWRATGASLCV
jgi:hypothetical protein